MPIRPTSDAQRKAVAAHAERLKAEGYKRISVTLSPRHQEIITANGGKAQAVIEAALEKLGGRR